MKYSVTYLQCNIWNVLSLPPINRLRPLFFNDCKKIEIILLLEIKLLNINYRIYKWAIATCDSILDLDIDIRFRSGFSLLLNPINES